MTALIPPTARRPCAVDRTGERDRPLTCRFVAATGPELDEEFGPGPLSSFTGSHIMPAPAERVRVRWRTATGSTYEIERDSAGMRWRRVRATLGSGTLRRPDDWPLLKWPEIQVGWPAVLIGPPLVATADLRVVRTSRVVNIIDE